MSHPFDIELSHDFPAEDRAQAKFEIAAINELAKIEFGFFQKAWSGGGSSSGKSDELIQDILDASLQYAFGSLYSGDR